MYDKVCNSIYFYRNTLFTCWRKQCFSFSFVCLCTFPILWISSLLHPNKSPLCFCLHTRFAETSHNQEIIKTLQYFIMSKTHATNRRCRFAAESLHLFWLWKHEVGLKNWLQELLKQHVREADSKIQKKRCF